MAVKISAIAFDGTGAGLASADLFVFTDVSDTTEAASGTTNKITFTELMKGIAASFTTSIVSTIGTITANTPALSATQTWNNSGTTFKGIFLNVTTTAQASGSRLIELQSSGTTRFAVDKDGYILNSTGYTFSDAINGPSNRVRIDNAGFKISTSSMLLFSSTGDTALIDMGVYRPNSSGLELNNGTAGTYRDLRLRTLRTEASTTSQASLKIPHGSAPTSPVDGDVWTTTAGLFVQVNGSTVGPLS